MKEYFVSGDIHGFYTQWMDALKNQNFDIDNPEHIIIVCGDLLDRGQEAKKVVDFVYDMMQKNRALLVKGNHEDLFKEMIARREPYSHDYHNGTVDTLIQLQKDPIWSEDAIITALYGTNQNYKLSVFEDLSNNVDPRWLEIIYNMKDYIELGNYIFVHGWVPTLYNEEIGKDMIDPDWRDCIDTEEWKNARWSNGMEMALVNHLTIDGKTIVCGHWHTSYGHAKKAHPNLSRYKLRYYEFESPEADFSVFRDKGIIAVDACTAHTGFVNVVHLKEDELDK